jgi:hypothetical protein
MFKVGQVFHQLTDSESPLKSPNTDLVGAWLTAGGKLYNRGYEDVVEDDRRFVTWVIDGNVSTTIDGDEVTFEQFQDRFLNQKWCEEHPESGITFMRAFRDNLRDLKKWAKDQPTGVRKRDAAGFAVVYPHSPQWLKDAFATRFSQV